MEVGKSRSRVVPVDPVGKYLGPIFLWNAPIVAKGYIASPTRSQLLSSTWVPMGAPCSSKRTISTLRTAERLGPARVRALNGWDGTNFHPRVLRGSVRVSSVRRVDPSELNN
eukprot:3938370-Rhodomonas_salina.1